MVSTHTNTQLNKLSLVILAVLGTLGFALSGGNKPANSAPINTTAPQANPTPAPHIDVTKSDMDMAARENQFGFGLLHCLDSGAGDNNTFVSPISINQALTMLYDGANGQTQAEIGKTLHYGELNTDAVNTGTSSLRQYIDGADPKVQIEIANAIWADKRMSFLDSYQSTCSKYFDAGAATLDFTSPNAAGTINQWVSDHTHGKIHSIVSSGDLTPAGAVLTDAVYFHGKWQFPFDAAATQQQPFTLSTGNKKMMMLMTNKKNYKYAETGNFQAVSVPYGDGTTSMWIILPKAGKSLSNIANSMTSDSWKSLTNSARTTFVELHLPKFHLDTSVTLNNVLQKLGIVSAFRNADFSPMSDTPLFVSKVYHKATLDVDEKGTVATAATGIVMNQMAVMRPIPQTPIVMRVDHPFLCAIQENQSGGILFLGCIRNPQALTAATD